MELYCKIYFTLTNFGRKNQNKTTRALLNPNPNPNQYVTSHLTETPQLVASGFSNFWVLAPSVVFFLFFLHFYLGWVLGRESWIFGPKRRVRGRWHPGAGYHHHQHRGLCMREIGTVTCDSGIKCAPNARISSGRELAFRRCFVCGFEPTLRRCKGHRKWNATMVNRPVLFGLFRSFWLLKQRLKFLTPG